MWYILSPDCNPDGTPCACKNIKSEGVSYTGPDLTCTGIKTNDTLTLALQLMDQKICGSRVTNGSLRTLDGSPLDTTLKVISDNTNVESPLRLSTQYITNYGAGNMSDNTVFGEGALESNVSGNSCTIFGAGAGASNTEGDYMTAFGAFALANCTSTGISQNTAVGAFAAQGVEGLATGDANTAVGSTALLNLAGGEHNIAIGYNAMRGTAGNIVQSASNNIAIGDGAGNRISTGASNIVLGNEGATNGLTTGSNNILIGHGPTGITTGTGNVVLGRPTGLLAAAINTVTIANGIGNIRMSFDTNGKGTIPNTLTATQFLLSALNSAPTQGSTGAIGEIKIDANYIYVCYATNTWKRAALTTF